MCLFTYGSFFKILLMFKLDQHYLHLDIRMITDKQSIVFLMSKVAVKNLHFYVY